MTGEETAAVKTLLQHGWSLNGRGKQITSLTPRYPTPLPKRATA